MDVTEAYAECERITRNEAKNFAYGIRLLPAPKRRAMSALYALARRIDDVGDGDLPVDSKLAALDGIEADLGEPGAHPDDPVMTAVADAAGTYPIPLTAFGEIIEGCRRDSTGTRYTTFEELVVYCRLVAGSVGRLSLGVFGCTRPEEGNRLADSLGVALQLTNILRDIVEDRTVMGRIYLPTEDIERFGCSPDLTGPEDAVAALVSFEAARADGWYDEGLALLDQLDRRSAACTAAMAGIYRRLLRRIQRDPAAVSAGRVSLPGWEKGLVAAGSLVGARP